MNLMFIQGGSRWKFDNKGNIYTDSNFSEKIWDRYRAYCNELTVILRREDFIYKEEIAQCRFNIFDTSKSKYISLPDIYRPIRRFFSFRTRRIIRRTIEQAVLDSDAVIIRSIGTYYTNTALRLARKYRKPYLVEVTGFSFESLWYHSILGKFSAFSNEIITKYLMKDVSWAIYVTNEALQKRYPCKGKSIGCSDVEIVLDNTVLENRIKKIQSKRIIIGTAAFLDVSWKGQIYVIRALAELKSQGIDCFYYQLIGAGTGKRLEQEAIRLGVREHVQIIGSLSHDKVFEWLDGIDVYVQSSFMEGLCRSVIEAMSRGCPVLCTDVGGNYELVDKKCLMNKGDVDSIVEKLRMTIDEDFRREQAKKNFEFAKCYEKNFLDKKRDDFYSVFFNDFVAKDDKE